MSFQTRGGTPPRRRNPSLLWLVLFGAVIALMVAKAGRGWVKYRVRRSGEDVDVDK